MKRFRNYIIKRGGRGLASFFPCLPKPWRRQVWFISFGAIAKRNEQGKEIKFLLQVGIERGIAPYCKYDIIQAMKPWEIKKTRDKLNKLTPEESLRIFFDLYQAGHQILRDSVLAENPRLTPKQLKIKLDNIHGSLSRS